MTTTVRPVTKTAVQHPTVKTIPSVVFLITSDVVAPALIKRNISRVSETSRLLYKYETSGLLYICDTSHLFYNHERSCLLYKCYIFIR